ncbi:MAG: glycosyltransferase family 4 protein [Gammaproteobacteria bacterium]|nr:glycosyltransferase family 4 protein [Gammaproteobacteria bacterium]
MNMYPPHSDGGYPLLCQETVEELKQRGHDVLVLTSNMGFDGRRIQESRLWRVFDYCPDNTGNELSSGRPLDLWYWYRREWIEHGFIQKALDDFRPEAIFVWATKGMSYSLAVRLMHYAAPKFAYVCGFWLSDHNKLAHLRRQYQFWQWGKNSGVVGFIRKMLRTLLEYKGIPMDFEPLVFDWLAFNNEDVFAGLPGPPAKSTPVQIYDSAPVERYAHVRPANIDRARRIILVGRIHPTKDQVTLARACALLQSQSEFADLELTLAGWHHDHVYLEALRDVIAAAPFPERLRIHDPVPFEEMPALFGAHDVVVVPSQVDPLPRVAAEGMAAGLPLVVSDQTGISRLLVNRKEALIFPAGDAETLANLLGEIMRSPELARSLSVLGRARALEYFSTKRMVDELEAFLIKGLASFRGSYEARLAEGQATA